MVVCCPCPMAIAGNRERASHASSAPDARVPGVKSQVEVVVVPASQTGEEYPIPADGSSLLLLVKHDDETKTNTHGTHSHTTVSPIQ